MVQNLPKLVDSSNVTMMNAIRRANTAAYQDRIPTVTEATIHETIREMMGNGYRTERNQFADVLMNRIGHVEVVRNSWQNKLREFKKGFLQEGSMVEEVAVGVAQGYVYDHDREAMEKMLFGTHKPEMQVSIHKVNRESVYPVTVNPMQLVRAFLGAQGGYNDVISSIMQSATTGDNWDEYLLMTSVIGEMWEAGGFYNVNVPDLTALTSSEADAKKTLRMLRTYAGKLQFISRKYNAAAMPMVVNDPSQLVIITTPEFRAAIDVDALAGAFNIERADVTGRIVEVQPEDVDIPGFQALMTTKDFFQVWDKVFEVTSQDNPVKLQSNHFLHHHQIISASRYVPALVFSTQPTTPSEPVTYAPASVEAITIEDKDRVTVTEVKPGEVYSLDTRVITTPVGGKLAFAWGLLGATDPSTRISDTGVLHVGVEEEGPTLKIVATSIDDSTKKATLDLTMDDAGVFKVWPRDREDEKDGVPGSPTP